MNKLITFDGFPSLYVYVLLACFLLAYILCCSSRRKDIKGQKILITGAGSGVGRQLAIQFSKYSTCLVLLDIDEPSLLATEKLLERQSTAFVYQCDVSKPEMVYKVAERIKIEVGDVDILVNNAGIAFGDRLLSSSDEKIVKTMEVNALAHFWMCKAFLPAMMSNNRGHIVSIVSVLGKVGVPRLTAYCASKFAASGFAESLEMELRQQKIDGIKVTIVCPSIIDTRLSQGIKVPFVSPMTPQYVAKEIVKAVLEEKELIYIPRWVLIFLTLNQKKKNEKCLSLSALVYI